MYNECDILFLCASEQLIHKENCHLLKTKIIVEGANGSITPWAHDYLTNKGVIIIPDLIAASGGLIVSYFEWLRNLQHVRMGMM